MLKIVTATRTEAEFKAGISVRGSLALKHAAQARALLLGRDFVVPEDVQDLVVPVFAHRLSLLRQSSDPMEERRAVTAVLRRIVGNLPTPV
jgi:MoxR-like ATPase